MNELQTVNEVARGISEYGVLTVIAAFFLVFAAGVMLWNMRAYKNLIERLVSDFSEKLDKLQTSADKNAQTMIDIAEGLIPETQLRIKNTSNVYFDLATEKVCRMIKKVREENHIADREATAKKIRTLLKNMYEDRNSRFDSYTYRGNRLSSYCNPVWIEWVAKAVEEELYNEAGPNNGRAYTNIKAVYDNIKLDFYHRLNN